MTSSLPSSLTVVWSALTAAVDRFCDQVTDREVFRFASVVEDYLIILVQG